MVFLCCGRFFVDEGVGSFFWIKFNEYGFFEEVFVGVVEFKVLNFFELGKELFDFKLVGIVFVVKVFDVDVFGLVFLWWECGENIGNFVFDDFFVFFVGDFEKGVVVKSSYDGIVGLEVLYVFEVVNVFEGNGFVFGIIGLFLYVFVVGKVVVIELKFNLCNC